MSKCNNFFKLLFFIGVLTSSNVIAQGTITTTEKLTNTTDGKLSLEDENGFVQDSSFVLKKNNAKYNRLPPKYPELRKEDIMFAETVWEDLDIREKKNRVFNYNKDDETGNQKFYEILLKILDEDSVNVKAYTDERFTTPITRSNLLDNLKGPYIKKAFAPEPPSTDTVYKIFRNSTAKGVPEADKVYTFRFKSQYIFDSRTSRMHYRILAIAPVATFKEKISVTDNAGITSEVDSTYQKVLFWLYYPKLRNQLANYIVYNPGNQLRQISWSDLLEARYFDAHIVKTSNNNFKDQSMFDRIKDPKKRLEAADKIKERIDNFEQDRWVY